MRTVEVDRVILSAVWERLADPDADLATVRQDVLALLEPYVFAASGRCYSGDVDGQGPEESRMSGLTDRLRQVAGQATPGPWDWNPKVSMLTSAVDACVPGTDGFAWRQLLDREAAVDDGVYRHIATFDPVLVWAMLDVIDAAEANRHHIDDEWTLLVDDQADANRWNHWEGKRMQLEADVAAALARFRVVAG